MYIYWWKKYFLKWQKGVKKKGYPQWQIEKLTQEMAIHQLELIENAKDNRKPNENQQEYLDWLEQIAKTGKLEDEIQGN